MEWGVDMTLSEKLNVYNQPLKAFLAEHDRVYLYGAGKVAARVCKYLNEKGLAWHGCIVSDKPSDGETLDGHPLVSFDEVDLNERDGILLAVAECRQDELVTIIASKYPNIAIYRQNMYSRTFNIPQRQPVVEPNKGFFAQFRILDDIGEHFQTDKSHLLHDYLRKYELFFQYFRDREFTLLELGIFRGESLFTWGAKGGYFTKATVIGVDINEKCRELVKDQQVIITDLSLEENLLKLRETHPSIIIDDASHCWSHQIMALFLLWDCLPSGGIYVVEDIETSFPNAGFLGFDDAVISAYDVCKDIAEVATSGVKLREQGEFSSEIEKIGLEVDMISFIHGSCIMIKK